MFANSCYILIGQAGFKAVKLAFFALVFNVSIVSCSQKKSAPSEEASESELISAGIPQQQIIVAVSPELLTAYPPDLVFASPFEPVSGENEPDESDEYFDYSTAVKNTWEKLNGASLETCLSSFTIESLPEFPSCYGPSIEYQGHPDGSPASGLFPANDLSIWTSVEPNKEACGAAKWNHDIRLFKAHASIGMDAIQLMICTASILNLQLPAAVDETLDYTEDINALLVDSDFSSELTGATVVREADIEDQLSYLSTVTIIRADESTVTVSLRHQQLAADNSLYRGKMWSTVISPDGSGKALSILYSKDVETNLVYEFRRAELGVLTDVGDAFDELFSVKEPVDESVFSWGIFSIDPNTGAGNYALAETIVSQTTNLNSMVGSLSVEDNVWSGCSYSGYGASLSDVLADETRASWLDRMICNRQGPGADLTGIASVQYQCFERDLTNGIFELTTSNIKFVPRNSCGIESEDNSLFLWRLEGADTAFNAFALGNELVETATAGESLLPPAPPAEL